MYTRLYINIYKYISIYNDIAERNKIIIYTKLKHTLKMLTDNNWVRLGKRSSITSFSM